MQESCLCRHHYPQPALLGHGHQKWPGAALMHLVIRLQARYQISASTPADSQMHPLADGPNLNSPIAVPQTLQSAGADSRLVVSGGLQAAGLPCYVDIKSVNIIHSQRAQLPREKT